jgi:sulfate adenylyltransferase subunit 2
MVFDSHLQMLEDESIYIIREAVAEFENPVFLYSIGKDSSVLLNLILKAFAPAKPPLRLLHIDTTWKFKEMIQFRDYQVKKFGLDLIVHTNPRGVSEEITPFGKWGKTYTDIMKTEALKQALNQYKFDVALGGARRDEEKSRAKERIFSLRNQFHAWDPKSQRPELFNIFNCKIKRSQDGGESMRVFPLSNWTEADIWDYIRLKNIEVVPLYFAKERPVVERDGVTIMVDDERFPLNSGEKPRMEKVRFRTLGCYPLTGAIRSTAETLDQIIAEMNESKFSERQGRLIDKDQAAAMEKKKLEGYF